ncbi:pollen-specific leucine-rich repeat extensin-like protein 1 isoform X2 [Sphaeramia orbicularis]|uniref:pollen-specific leucine-rich repeat extensin-like protein 1 isoform X2 n=1 Tax=Sphaeramia orbicularis TaxID=375764 RepID=UPI00117F13B4|nr:pollen-specific leucine-rich repeat extensin-like protein 1 isoform X2 [Sphaeramia orbicularis]
MRTLMLTMLMLISIDACSAMPRAVNDIAPVSCCVQFFTGNIPPARIVSIKKTDSTCTNKAFVVTTVKGAKICVRDAWVHSVFKQPDEVQSQEPVVMRGLVLSGWKEKGVSDHQRPSSTRPKEQRHHFIPGHGIHQPSPGTRSADQQRSLKPEIQPRLSGTKPEIQPRPSSTRPKEQQHHFIPGHGIHQPSPGTRSADQQRSSKPEIQPRSSGTKPEIQPRPSSTRPKEQRHHFIPGHGIHQPSPGTRSADQQRSSKPEIQPRPSSSRSMVHQPPSSSKPAAQQPSSGSSPDEHQCTPTPIPADQHPPPRPPVDHHAPSHPSNSDPFNQSEAEPGASNDEGIGPVRMEGKGSHPHQGAAADPGNQAPVTQRHIPTSGRGPTGTPTHQREGADPSDRRCHSLRRRSTVIPHAVNDITPVPCCTQFFTGNIPPAKIASIE